MAVRWFQFSVRDWFALVVIVAVCFGWWRDHQQLKRLEAALVRERVIARSDLAEAKSELERTERLVHRLKEENINAMFRFSAEIEEAERNLNTP